MGNPRKNANPMKIAGLCLLAVLLVAIGWIGANVVRLGREASFLANATPTPEPKMDNVLKVTVDPSLPTPEPLIKTGMKGEIVKKLQKRLQELGYYFDEVDGQFGAGTKAAVVWFQSQHGLDADGIAGPSTQELLYSDRAQRAAATPTPGPTAVPSAAPTQDPGLPLLVNSAYPATENDTPADLVFLADVCDPSVVTIKNPETQGGRQAAEALETMLLAAREDGLTSWQVSAGYRSYAYQQELLDKQVADNMRSGKITRELALQAALEVVALPGTTDHHTGLGFDITVPNTGSFTGTRQCQWLSDHCWEYGFILRYPRGKEEITGFDHEPWHVRYVGKEHSIPIRDQGLCLEEYVQAKMGL